MALRFWTREELILAFNLYLKLPFGKMHKTNPEVMHLAQLKKRTPSSVAMRLSNYASLDPYHQKRGISGLPGGTKQCKPIWDEFHANREELLFESECLLAEREHLTIEGKYKEILQDKNTIKGGIKLREVKYRINQYVFRQIVISNYSSKCALTGIDLPELLVASHIIPWAVNEEERLNPENGLCLSQLYDKAFDRGLLGVNLQLKVVLAKELKEQIAKSYYERHFGYLNGVRIRNPDRFLPRKDFLEYHMDVIFRK